MLHRNGLVHGDVSPRNLIISGGDIVLTDYDFVTKIGEAAVGPGTVLYCSPSLEHHEPVAPSDDLYALAATFFQVLFEKEPFAYDGSRAKQRGINWNGLDPSPTSTLVSFLRRATHPDQSQRFASAKEALQCLVAAPESQHQDRSGASAAAETRAVGDASTDDTFAHLSIFVQRQVQEDERRLMGWNPMQDEFLFGIVCRRLRRQVVRSSRS